MRIALAVERFDKASGGQAIWARGFADYLKGRGHHVDVVATQFDPEDVNCHQVRRHWSPRRRADAFNAAIAAVKADVVHDSGVAVWPGVFHPQTGSALHSLDRSIATEPPVRRVRAALSPKMILLRHEMRQLERAQTAAARRVIAISPLVERLLQAQHPHGAGKIVCMSNGVDTEHFRPDASAQSIPSVLRVAAAAHNPTLKGLDTVFGAIALLRQRGVAVSLVVAGTSGDGGWRDLAARQGIAECVSFLGVLGDMRLFYRMADVLVHATRWDAYSLVTLEAMSCGLPVITTAACGAAEAIEHGVSGFVVPQPDDAAAFAQHLVELGDETRHRAMGQAAREAALARDLGANHAAVEAVLLETASVTSRTRTS